MSRGRSIRERILLASLIIALWATALAAGNREGAVTIGFLLGQTYYSGESDYGDAATLGMSLGYNIDEALSAELSVSHAGSNEETMEDDKEDASVTLYRLEGLYHLGPLWGNEKLLPFFAAGTGAMQFKSERPGMDTDLDITLNFGGGLKYLINDGLAVRGDVREVINFKQPRDQQYNFLYTVSFIMSFGGPEEVQVVKAEPVYEPESVPEPEPEEEPVPVKEEPLADADGDGVPDGPDRCPNTPKGVKVDAGGCPVPEKSVVTPQGTYDFGSIYFDSGKARIKAASLPVLNNVAEYLKKYPDVKLEVQGHTDSTGAAAYNRKLSGDRARAVRTYLTGKGIAPERLTARGYGMSSPIAANSTKAGRAKNRRTVFLPIR